MAPENVNQECEMVEETKEPQKKKSKKATSKTKKPSKKATELSLTKKAIAETKER